VGTVAQTKVPQSLAQRILDPLFREAVKELL
jgi:hypothetical protein